VVDDVSGARASSLAGGWTGVGALESSPLRRITLDPTVGVSRTGSALYS